MLRVLVCRSCGFFGELGFLFLFYERCGELSIARELLSLPYSQVRERVHGRKVARTALVARVLGALYKAAQKQGAYCSCGIDPSYEIYLTSCRASSIYDHGEGFEARLP